MESPGWSEAKPRVLHKVCRHPKPQRGGREIADSPAEVHITGCWAKGLARVRHSLQPARTRIRQTQRATVFVPSSSELLYLYPLGISDQKPATCKTHHEKTGKTEREPEEEPINQRCRIGGPFLHQAVGCQIDFF